MDVTVAQPDPLNVYRFNRDGFETNTQGGFSGGHFEAGLNFTNSSQIVTQTIDFSNNSQSGADSVTDVSFTLFDIDSTASGTFQDQITVLAFDALGNPLTVTLTAVNIAGEVASIQIIYGNGPGAQSNPSSQAVGVGDLSFDLIPAAPCFLPDTRIQTPDGEVSVEMLVAGDMVTTADHGAQPLRWMSSDALRELEALFPGLLKTRISMARRRAGA